jgi:hypothetical protein
LTIISLLRAHHRYAVPAELALLYDFVNTLDERRYVENGTTHTGGDEIETPRLLESWMRERGLLHRGEHVDARDHPAALERVSRSDQLIAIVTEPISKLKLGSSCIARSSLGTASSKRRARKCAVPITPVPTRARGLSRSEVSSCSIAMSG